ncbi:hypothetical protein ACI7RC_20820 [Brevibacillus sp. B_LB10_24]
MGTISAVRPGLHHLQMSFRLDTLVWGSQILTAAMLAAAES